MRSLSAIISTNDRAVMREYADALADGNMTLAAQISAANPDLFPERRPTQRVQSQTARALVGLLVGLLFAGCSCAQLVKPETRAYHMDRCLDELADAATQGIARAVVGAI